MNNNILVAGGAGYVGSHMVRMLKDNGYNPVVFDNLSTGHQEFVPKDVVFVKGDLRKPGKMEKLLKSCRISAVMHFAASSLVGESMKDPLKYYENNVLACIGIIKAMIKYKAKKLIFSSSAAVYGEPERVPIKEEDETRPTNPYGRSKLMIEKILKDSSEAYDLSYISLRYFNASGAHSSGEIGELHDPETHLIPNILKAAKGENKELTIFGNNYPTPDGSCVRDYVHVQDLCSAHLLALKALEKGMKRGIFNLGNGNGYSVKEIVKSAEMVTGKKIKVKIGPRRAGDPARLVASPEKAVKVLGWKRKYNLHDIIGSAWGWENRIWAQRKK